MIGQDLAAVVPAYSRATHLWSGGWTVSADPCGIS